LLTQLLSHLEAGGITGYITNSLAIKMLFKKYPIIGGGVLVDNFDEFVENISLLVERDLINHATLEEEFQTEHFRKALKKSLEYLLKRSLFKTFDDVKLKEIDGLSETLSSIFDFIEPFEEALLDSLLQELSGAIEIDDLLPSTQLQRLSDRLFGELFTIIKQQLPRIFSDLKNSELTFEALLVKEFNTLFQIQLQTNISMLLESISTQQKSLETVLDLFLKRLKTDLLLRQLTQQLFSKSIEEIIGSKAKSRFSADLIERFILMLENDPELQQLTQLSTAMLDALNTVEYPLTHYMNEETTAKIITLIQIYLPQVLEHITGWIDENEEDLEELIERLIDTTLTQGGLLGKMKLTFKTIFLGKITERFKLLDRVNGMIQDEQSREQHLQRAVTLVLDAISRRNIGDVVQELRSRHWLSAKLVAKLIHFNLRHAAPLIEKIMLDELLSRPLSSLFTPSWQETLFILAEQKLEPKTVAQQFAHPPSQERLSKWGADTLTSLTKYPIAAMLTGITSTQVLRHFEANKTIFQTLFFERLQTYLSGEKLSKLIDHQTLTLIEPLILQKIAQGKPRWHEQIASLPLHTLFNELSSHPNSADALTNIVVMGLNDNLHHLLEENVSHTVKNELLKMGPSLLQERVEDFMGKELGPITWLGAGIGTGVGGLLYASQSLFGAVSSPYIYGLIPAVYGATGILTNYLALKMLFKPYKQYRVLGLPVPFTPGIVGKRQPFFAKNMSEFVDETLLTSSAIHEKIINFKPQLSHALKSYITRDNYQMIDDFLHDHGDFFTQQLLEYGFEQLPKRLKTKPLAYKTVQTLNSTNLQFLLESSTQHSLKTVLNERIKSQMKTSIQLWFENSTDKPLIEALPPTLNRLIDKLIPPAIHHGIHSITDTLDSQERFEVLAERITDSLLKQLRDEKLSTLIPKGMQTLLDERIVHYILTHVQNPSTLHKLTAFIQSLVVNETSHNDSKIGELFNGALTQIIEKNLRMLFDHGFDEILHHIQAEKPLLQKEIRTLIKSQNSFVTNRLIKVAGVYGDVERFITIFVDEELPRFLDERHSEIEQYVHTFFDKIKEKELKEFAINSELFNLHAFEPLLGQIIQYPSVAKSISSIAKAMIDALFESTLNEQLHVLQWHHARDILHSFTEETSLIRSHLQHNLAAHQKELTVAATAFTKEVWQAFSTVQSLRSLFPALTMEVLQKQLNHNLEPILNSSASNAILHKLMTVLVKHFEREGVQGFVDEKKLQDSLELIFTQLLNNETLMQHVKLELQPILSELIMSMNSLSDDTLKQYMINNGFEAAYDTLLVNFKELINAIDFKGVIEREINKMHPKELEDMLNSFAKVYFNRLIFYGGYGALFGIPVAFTY